MDPIAVIEALFAMSPASFRARHWPARACCVAGTASRAAAMPTAPMVPAWRDQLVAELGLGFAAPAVSGRIEAIPAGATVGVRRDRETIAVVLAGRMRWPGADGGVLTPGAALFIPRGQASPLEALDDARALVFELAVPTWIDLLANTAMLELSAAPGWRAPRTAGGEPASITEAIALLAASPPPSRGGQS